MSLFFCSYVSKKDPDKCKVLCKVQTQSPPIIPFFVFVGPAERCNLSNFGNPWCVAAASIQFFRKKSCSSVSWHFWPMGILLEEVKEYKRKRMLGIEVS
jgi:hypothetical protein